MGGGRVGMFDFLKTLFRSRKAPGEPGLALEPGPPSRVPDNTRVYAIGDIHGRVDLLRRLHAMIEQENAGLPEGVRKIVVYLGDYIDRGDGSRAVIDLLLEQPLPGCERVHLKGNHEAELQDFLANPRPSHTWTLYGGMATALSYRVRTAPRISALERMQELRQKLLEAMPPAHQAFFSSLWFRFEIGDYFLVHAGVRPGVALDKQNPADMLWIREPFLSTKQSFGKRVVHGHTVTDEPEVRTNRIGIDTGAYFSGRLTCLVLEGESFRFLVT